jgi:hypothetical protein
LRDQPEAPNIRNPASIRHRYDPNFAPTPSQLDAPAPSPVNPTAAAVKPSKPPRLTPSSSATASPTNTRTSSASVQRTTNARAKSYSTPAQHSPAPSPYYGQRHMQDDTSISGGYNASSYYAGQPPLNSVGTNNFTILSNPQGQWPNQYARGGWEVNRNNSRRLPQGASSEYWHEQGSRASQARPGMPGIGIFTTSSTISHSGTGNLRPIPTGPRGDRAPPYPPNPTTIEPTAVFPTIQYSLPIGVETSQEIQPQLSATYGLQTPISTQSQFSNYQGPVPPPIQQSVLKMELPPVQTQDPSNTRSDVASEEHLSQGHMHSAPSDSFDTLPTPVTPSVLQLPSSSPPKGPILPTIGDILLPLSEPYKRNVFSRMQEVVYDSPDLASVLLEAELNGRPVVVRNFPLCAWWANTPLNPRNLQKILERPTQPCTGAISMLQIPRSNVEQLIDPKNKNTLRCVHLNAVTESLPQPACLSSDLPADTRVNSLFVTHTH